MIDDHGTTSSLQYLPSAEEVKRRMDAVIEGNDGLRRFVDHCAFLSFVVENRADCLPHSIKMITMGIF